MTTWRTRSLALALLTIGTVGAVSFTLAEEGQSLEQRIAAAKTPADHRAVADFYRTESTKLQREAEQHAALAQTWSSEAGGQNPSASHHYEQAEHCRKFATALSEAAQEARALEKIHESRAQSSAGDRK